MTFSENILLLLPSVTTQQGVDGRLLLPRKLLDGVCEYARLWNGRIIVAMQPSQGTDWTMDLLQVRREELPFEIQMLPAGTPAPRELIRTAALVFAVLIPRFAHLAAMSTAESVPIVYDADMPFAVRAGIIRISTRNPLRRWRQLLWNRKLETRYRSALGKASGIQCNGLVTFEAYRTLTPRPLLYLNTRVRREMLATSEERERRRARIADRQPLRLVFSGRLVSMKGVLDLPRVAAALKRRGVNFTLDIFGGGNLEPALRDEIDALQVADCVQLRGEIPFPELVRRVASEADLFVCCHPQGDPSTTFIETMSGGVPVIGYDTLSLSSIVRLARAGWLTPCGQPDALAARIDALDRARGELIDAAQSAFEFARGRTFEQTMAARVEHLQQCRGSVSPSS